MGRLTDLGGNNMNLGIIGYGGVGKALIKLLIEKEHYLISEGILPKIVFILKSNGGIYDPDGIDYKNLAKYPEKEWHSNDHAIDSSDKLDLEYLLDNSDIDILIELTPTNIDTGEPALTHMKMALSRGINVITANKGPILLAYHELRELARHKRAQLYIGCTTGGALPTINGGLIDLAGATITAIEGLLNGTTNFILNEMEEKGVSYEEALKTAQRQGIAETNPSLDVDGWDTATKLLILTNVLMGTDIKLEDIKVEGISRISIEDIKEAAKEDKKLKLIGKALKTDNKIDIQVKLEKLEKNHPLYNVNGKNKGVKYTSDSLGDLTIIGGASGVTPAAASILRDIINFHKGYKMFM